LFVTNDVSFSSKLYVADDISTNANLYVTKHAQVDGSLNVVGDVAIDTRLFVSNDASFSSKLYVVDDASMDSNLYVGKHTRVDGSLNVVGDVAIDTRLFVSNDASFSSKLYVVDDASMDSNLYIGKHARVDGSLNIIGDAKINNRLFVTNDASFSSNLYVDSDISTNANLYVAKHEKVDGSLNVVGDVAIDNRLFVTNDASFSSKLYVDSDISTNANLYVAKHAKVDGSLNVVGDIGIDNRLFVTNDASFSSKLYVDSDISTNANLYVAKHAKVDGSLNVVGDIGIDNRLFVSEISTFGSSTGATIDKDGVVAIKNVTNSTSSLTGALQVTGGVGIDKSLFIGEDINVSGNLIVSGTTTTVNTANIDISDSLIGLSSGTTGTPINDSGLLITRGNESSVFMGWDEQLDKFVLKTTNNSSAMAGALAFTGTNTISTNLEIPNNGSIGSLTEPNAMSINAFGDISINTTTNSSSLSTGALKIAGGAGIAKDVNIGENLYLKKDGAILNIGENDDFNITHDGITGATIHANPLNINSQSSSNYSTVTGELTINGADGINLQANASKLHVNTTDAVDISAGTFSIDATSTVNIDATSTIAINSTGGEINVGNNDDSQNINIGSSISARTIQIGNSSSTAVNVDAKAINLTSVDEMLLTDGTGVIKMDGSGATDISAVTFDIQVVNNKITMDTTGTDISGTTGMNDTLTISKSTGKGLHVVADASFDNIVAVGENIVVDHIYIGRGAHAPPDAFGSYGERNTAMGYDSLVQNTAGNNNTALGYNTLKSNLYGYGNTAVGSDTLTAAGIAINNSNNTAIGFEAGINTVGNNNTLIGAGTDAFQGMLNQINNSTAIGYNAKITESNQILIGTLNEKVYIPGKLDTDLDASFGQSVSIGGKMTIGADSINTTDLSNDITLFADASNVIIGGANTNLVIGNGTGRIETGYVTDTVNVIGDFDVTGTASFGAFNLDISNNFILLNSNGTETAFPGAGVNIQLLEDMSAGYIRIDPGLDKFAVHLPNMEGGVEQYIATKDTNNDFAANKIVALDDVSLNTNVKIGGNLVNTGTLDVSGVTNFETDVTFNGGLIDFSSANTLGDWKGSVTDRTGGTLIIEDNAITGPIVHADLDGTVTTPVQNSIATMTGVTEVGTTAIDTTFSGPIVANEGITSTGNITMTNKFIKQF